MSLNRYFPYESHDPILDQAMLPLMSRISAKYFSPLSKNRHYCRAVAGVQTHSGEKHLICVASTHIHGKIFHAEELLIETLFELYKNDATIVRQSANGIFKIKADYIYIDIEPCDGVRYGKAHHCQQYFTTGRKIKASINKKAKAVIDSSTEVYWNAMLPPEDAGTNCRSEGIEREYCILNLDIETNDDAQLAQQRWNKCFIVEGRGISETGTVIPVEINLANFIVPVEPITQEESETKEWLQALIADSSHPISGATSNILSHLFWPENNRHLQKLIKAIIKDWQLNILAIIPAFNLSHISAIKELQSLYSSTIKKIQPIILPPVAPVESPRIKEVGNIPNDIKRFYRLLNSTHAEELQVFLSNSTAREALFIDADYYEYNALMTAMLFSSAEIQEIIFSELKKLLKTKKISPAQWMKILQQKTADGSNIITAISRLNDPDRVLKCFLFLHELKQLNYISTQILEALLTEKNKAGYTSLYEVLLKGQVENTALYFKWIQEILDKNDLVELLMSYTNSGFTSLHAAAESDVIDNIALYFHLIKNILTEDQVVALLLKCNVAGFSAFQTALLKGNVKVVEMFFDLINKYLSDDNLLTLLNYANKEGNSAFHTVLIQGDNKNISRFLAILEKLEAHDLANILMQVSSKGFSTLHFILTNGNTENLTKHFNLIKKTLTYSEIVQLFSQANEEGFTSLHTLLKGCTFANANLYFDFLKEVFSTEDLIQLLMKPTKHGFTGIQIALINGNPFILKILLTLMHHIPDDCLLKVILEPNKEGYTSLHSVLINGNAENVLLYLNFLNENLAKSDLVKLFLQVNNAGISILNDAIMHGNGNNLFVLLDFIKRNLTTDDLINLFKVSLTSFQEVFKSKNLKNIKIFMNFIKENLPLDILTALITTQNKEGFTSFHDVLLHGTPEIFNLYADLLKALSLSRDQLADLLTRANIQGFTPLHEALINGHPENFAFYIKLLKEALSPEELALILVKPNAAGFTPLHDALRNGQPENVAIYFNLLEECVANQTLSRDTLLEVLESPNTAGFTSLHQALKNGQPDNLVLLFDKLKQLSPARHESLLCAPTQKGYTPLHCAILSASNNFQILKLFIDHIVISFPLNAEEREAKLVYSLKALRIINSQLALLLNQNIERGSFKDKLKTSTHPCSKRIAQSNKYKEVNEYLGKLAGKLHNDRIKRRALAEKRQRNLAASVANTDENTSPSYLNSLLGQLDKYTASRQSMKRTHRVMEKIPASGVSATRCKAVLFPINNKKQRPTPKATLTAPTLKRE